MEELIDKLQERIRQEVIWEGVDEWLKEVGRCLESLGPNL